MGFTPSLLKKQMTERSSFWCTLEAGPPTLHYYFAVVLLSCIILPPVGHSSYHEYRYCQLTRQTSCVLNFYCTFKIFHLNLPRIRFLRTRSNRFTIGYHRYIAYLRQIVTTQNLAFLSYWYRKKRLQMHF
jgi:hypothetical protein